MRGLLHAHVGSEACQFKSNRLTALHSDLQLSCAKIRAHCKYLYLETVTTMRPALARGFEVPCSRPAYATVETSMMRRARAELRAELEFRPTTSTCPRAWQKLFVARACARGMSKMSGFASQYRIGRQRVLPMDHHTRLARNLKQLGEVEPGCPRTLMTSSSPFGASIHGGIDWLLDDRGGRRFQLG